jgi:SAM-dependent methyltransferase
MKKNKDQLTVDGFGDEWERFDQSELELHEYRELFDRYFSIFPWDDLGEQAVGFDMGCGSGRWAKLVAPKVRRLHCIDPSSALEVARRNLKNEPRCEFHAADVDDEVLPEGSADFGYSLGVLHHVPDTAEGIKSCVKMLKPGAPFLLYLYYAFDNRPLWFRLLWRSSEAIRFVVSRLPNTLRFWVSQIVALVIYWPLARLAKAAEVLGLSGEKLNSFPLSAYRNLSFYTMRTDSLDRFGTRLEQRFTRAQIASMMESAGLEGIRFSESVPYWCAVGNRKKENREC